MEIFLDKLVSTNWCKYVYQDLPKKIRWNRGWGKKFIGS